MLKIFISFMNMCFYVLRCVKVKFNIFLLYRQLVEKNKMFIMSWCTKITHKFVRKWDVSLIDWIRISGKILKSILILNFFFCIFRTSLCLFFILYISMPTVERKRGRWDKLPSLTYLHPKRVSQKIPPPPNPIKKEEEKKTTYLL